MTASTRRPSLLQKTLNGGYPGTGYLSRTPSRVVMAVDSDCAYPGNRKMSSHASSTAL
jgi:hypothetical protein